MNWMLGISVFFAIGKIGVFGLGYGDLEKMFYGSISGPQALILLIAKLAATTAVYAWAVLAGSFLLPSSLALQSVSPSLTRLRTRAAPAGE